jgi:hypothetical protein
VGTIGVLIGRLAVSGSLCSAPEGRPKLHHEDRNLSGWRQRSPPASSDADPAVAS